MARGIAALSLFLTLAGVGRADSKNQVFEDFTTPLPLQAHQTLVLGIAGGWERWDNEQRLTQRIAVQVRDLKAPNVFVETVENHKIHLGDELVRRAFPDPAQARLIVFGHSLGGAETSRLCKRMNALGIPVMLAVIIDGVGREDYVLPPNVKAAANLYERDSYPPIAGEPTIHAADPSKTTILGNWQYRYDYRHWKGKKIEMPPFETRLRWSWMGGHLRMEYDPDVWAKVTGLIGDCLRANPAPEPVPTASNPPQH